MQQGAPPPPPPPQPQIPGLSQHERDHFGALRIYLLFNFKRVQWILKYLQKQGAPEFQNHTRQWVYKQRFEMHHPRITNSLSAWAILKLLTSQPVPYYQYYPTPFEALIAYAQKTSHEIESFFREFKNRTITLLDKIRDLLIQREQQNNWGGQFNALGPERMYFKNFTATNDRTIWFHQYVRGYTPPPINNVPQHYMPGLIDLVRNFTDNYWRVMNPLINVYNLKLQGTQFNYPQNGPQHANIAALTPIDYVQQDQARVQAQNARPNNPDYNYLNEQHVNVPQGDRPILTELRAPLRSLLSFSTPPPEHALPNPQFDISDKEFYFTFDDDPQLNLNDPKYHTRLDRSVCHAVRVKNEGNNTYKCVPCNEKTVVGLEMCWYHLRYYCHIAVQQTRERELIPHQPNNPGEDTRYPVVGLFAYVPRRQPVALRHNPVFRKGEKIFPFNGIRENAHVLNQVYMNDSNQQVHEGMNPFIFRAPTDPHAIPINHYQDYQYIDCSQR
jgi:hypothetical protein